MLHHTGMLAVDVDGTLITDHGHVTDDVYHALERAAAADWEIVIASGRTFHAAQAVLGLVPFVQYAVLSNGACIMDVREDHIMALHTLEEAQVAHAVQVIREGGAIPALYDADIHDQSVYYDTLDGASEYFRWYVREDPRTRKIDDVLAAPGDFLQIGAIAEKRIIHEIRDILRESDMHVMALPFESPRFGGKNQDYWFLQVVHGLASKIAALRQLGVWLGIPCRNLVAVGDNYNDAEMIEKADVGVAMGNAPDEIRAVADVVVGTNNDSGLREVVEDVLLSGKYFPETH